MIPRAFILSPFRGLIKGRGHYGRRVCCYYEPHSYCSHHCNWPQMDTVLRADDIYPFIFGGAVHQLSTKLEINRYNVFHYRTMHAGCFEVK